MKTSFLRPVPLILLLAASFIFGANHGMAQVNLVPNPGFENFITCPVGFSSFNGYVSDWNNPSAASPDYMNACATPFPAGAPANGTGYQVPHSGGGYAGAYLTGGIYKEYIQIHLSSPLVAGNLYDFKMYVVLHNKSQTASDDIGAYFSVTAPVSAGTGYLNGNPVAQITNPSGNVITDSLNWTLVSGTYAAAGGEQYITLGHFKTDAATTYLTVNYGSQGTYYYFDDVSLTSAANLPVELLSFDAECSNNETVITWSTASEQNLCCFDVEKSCDAKNFIPVAHIVSEGNSDQKKDYRVTDVNPGKETFYYRLRQSGLDGSYSYSHIVAFSNAACHDRLVPATYFHYGMLHLINSDGYAAEVINVKGQIVFQTGYLSSTVAIFSLTTFPHGIYIIRLFSRESNRCFTVKAVKM